MKKITGFITGFMIGGLLLAASAQAQEAEKLLLEVKHGCVQGLVIKFEDRAGDFGKEAPVDMAIAEFNEDDYTIDNPAEFATLRRDSNNYPPPCTIFHEMGWKEEQAKADAAASQDAIKSSDVSTATDQVEPEEKK